MLYRVVSLRQTGIDNKKTVVLQSLSNVTQAAALDLHPPPSMPVISLLAMHDG
jgi:hypothetical protein